MLLVGLSAESRIHVGDQVVGKRALEAGLGDDLVEVGTLARGRPGSSWTKGLVGLAIRHHDNEGLRLSLGDQIVHDEVRAALIPPGVLVLTPAMLQIENRITLPSALLIVRRG